MLSKGVFVPGMELRELHPSPRIPSRAPALRFPVTELATSMLWPEIGAPAKFTVSNPTVPVAAEPSPYTTEKPVDEFWNDVERLG